MDDTITVDDPHTVPTRHWHLLEDGRVQCDVCPRACRLHEGPGQPLCQDPWTPYGLSHHVGSPGPSCSRHARGHTSHWTLPSSSKCQCRVGTVCGSSTVMVSSIADASRTQRYVPGDRTWGYVAGRPPAAHGAAARAPLLQCCTGGDD